MRITEIKTRRMVRAVHHLGGQGLILDLMETWDEEKLRNVVTQNAKGQRTTTDVSGEGEAVELIRDCVQILYSSD